MKRSSGDGIVLTTLTLLCGFVVAGAIIILLVAWLVAMISGVFGIFQ